MTTRQDEPIHHPPEIGHLDDLEWQMGRFDGGWTKMLFRPNPARPTEPNAGVLRYEPGANFATHKHDFAQVWYVIEGEFHFGEHVCGPGSMLFFPDPHFEYAMRTETGGKILFVQYPGPSTGACPIYDGRFNVKERKPDEENLEY